MEQLFNINWEQILRIIVAGFCIYLILIFLLRISGKRTLSKWNAFDFVVTVALGSTLATGLLDKNISLAESAVAFGTLVFLQYLATWLAVRVSFLHTMLKAQPSIIFKNGDFMETQMKKKRVTKSEILAAIRSKGHGSLKEIAAVVLETDGSFSIIKNYDAHPEMSTLANTEGFEEGSIK